MVTNPYFNNWDQTGEQRLLEDLVIESIKIYGNDMYYIPRYLDNHDTLYQESDIKNFESAHLVEFYISNVDGWEGDGSFLSKIGGWEIRKQITLVIAQRVFQEEVNAYEPTLQLTRPREGDLIYFPLNQKCFQVHYVDKWDMYYQLGALQTWKLTCELFQYSAERFNTGIPEIDRLAWAHSLDIFDNALHDEYGNPLLDESNNFIVPETFDNSTIVPLADNDILQQESDTFVDFTEIDPFSEGNV